MIERDISTLLLSIHEGPFERPYWRGFLDQLREWTGADYVSLAFKRPSVDAAETTVIRAGRVEDDPYREMLKDFRASAIPHPGLAPGVVYTVEEMLDESKVEHVKYMEYLRLRGFRHSRMIRVRESGGANAWLAIQSGALDFTARDDELLRTVSPHLAVAIRHLMSHERESIRAQVALDAIRRLNYNWLTLDELGRVVELDEGADSLFRELPMKAVAPGRPFPSPTPGVSKAIASALASFIATPNAPPSAIHLMDEPWVDMLALPIPERSISNDLSPVVVLYVYRAPAQDVDRSGRLMELYGLTRTEARLALALSEGKGIAVAAEKLGLTLETARNYSKRIYDKTSTRGQAELVRLIVSGVVALS